MNKKGFTLIELLTVIVLLGVIALITTPLVINVINDSKDKAYEHQKKIIVNAAERWGTENIQSLPKKNFCCISAKQLKSEGYLSNNQDIKDPRDSNKDMGFVKISFSRINHTYSYIYSEKCTKNCIGD